MRNSITQASPPETGDVGRFWASLEAGQLTGHSYVILLGLKTFDTPSLLERVKKGLSYRAWERFVHNVALPNDAVETLVGISRRTLTRRRGEGRLHPDESDRLLRATRVFAKALVLFEGDAAQARHWLRSPQLALGGSRALDYAATDVGAREVESLIGRLEDGIPS